MPQAVPAPAPGAAGTSAGGVRGTAGFYRAGKDAAGRWWLLTPHDAPVFLASVHGVRGAGAQGDGELPLDPMGRLRRWGFNAVGVCGRGEEAAREDGWPFLLAVDFCRAGPTLVAPGLRLPDVFDPEWPRRAHSHAQTVCSRWSDCSELVGWVTDNATAWAQPTLAGRPSLLQLCLSQEPRVAAYHAAWEFVLALHAGRIEAVAEAWSTRLPNKEVVRELTRAEEGLGTRGYLRDDARWTREMARRYFSATAAAIRTAAPNHLLLGCRFRQPVGAAVLAECTYPAVDVAMPHWTELPAAAIQPSQPVIAGDVGWGCEIALRPGTGAMGRRLTTIERMLQRGRSTLTRLARHPAAIGYAWSQWQDEPGEQPPFASGLIHVNGTEAREHTELLADFNLRAASIRRLSTPL